MNQHDFEEPLDHASTAWLEGVLFADASAAHQLEDAQFASRLMAALPQQRRHFNPAQLARLLLSGVACGAAAMVVITRGETLVSSFDQAAVGLHAEVMISAVAPFAVLAGLMFFAFRLQRD